jgi:hypothetical protein
VTYLLTPLIIHITHFCNLEVFLLFESPPQKARPCQMSLKMYKTIIPYNMLSHYIMTKCNPYNKIYCVCSLVTLDILCCYTSPVCTEGNYMNVNISTWVKCVYVCVKQSILTFSQNDHEVYTYPSWLKYRLQGTHLRQWFPFCHSQNLWTYIKYFMGFSRNKEHISIVLKIILK